MAHRKQLPPALRSPGEAMLEAMTRDLIAAGHQVLTTLDSRIVFPLSKLPGITVTVIHQITHLERVLHQMAAHCDAALIIAPESDRLSEQWALKILTTGIRSLGCSPGAIQLCSDKLALSRHLNKHRVPTPATVPFEQVKQWPASPQRIFKPRWGAGCEHTFVCRSDQMPDAMHHPQNIIVQPYLPGLAASASFLIHEQQIIALPPGQQIIESGRQLSYLGGRIPLDDDLAQRAVALGKRAIQTIPGLHGWVGVDLILDDKPVGDQVIEINPRLTMSYVGLRAICEHNLAAAWLDPDAPLSFTPRQRVSFDWSGRCQLRKIP